VSSEAYGPGFPCPVAWLNEIVGDGWTPLILRDAMFGLRRFEDFHRNQGIGRNTLSQRLADLVDAGLMRTEIYRDNPPRKEYILTDKGRELFGVLSTMVAWSERWLEGADGLVEFHHRCGERAHAQVMCSCCGEPLELADVEFRLGPGFPESMAGRPDIERRFGTREA
jgi:DNA-binding HxlR family transcriptional regulator